MTLPLMTTALVWPLLPDRPKGRHPIPALIEAISPTLNPGSRLFIWPDMESTALVWHLGMGTVYAPYHQNVDGILDGIQFRRTSDPRLIHEMLKKRGISHVIMPRSLDDSLKDTPGVFTQIAQGSPPPFLEPAALPKDLSESYLFFSVK
jgi:hypothetical protein